MQRSEVCFSENPREEQIITLVKDFSKGSLSLKVGALIEAYQGYIDSPEFPNREPHEIAQTTKEMMDVIYFCVRAKELMAD
ncbi:MAG: hypothetical protein PUB21_11825 [Bacteroidales bacterium]|nr:hypothetical protein [Bacteroidales bacterium]